jgi:hypothetical protein
MTISYESLLAQRAEHHKAFGQMLRCWREANGWTSYDPSRLGETKGFRPVPYGLWQELEEGHAGVLQLDTFMALGETNAHASVPIVDPYRAAIWTPPDFWSCYCGLLDVPEQWRQP